MLEAPVFLPWGLTRILPVILPPQGSLRGDFSLGHKPTSFAPPAPAFACSCQETTAVSLRKAHSLAGPRPSVILSETDPLVGSPVPVQEPRICRHSSAHYPPDVFSIMARRSIPQPVILAVAVFSTGRAVLPTRVWHSASGPTAQKCGDGPSSKRCGVTRGQL